MGAYIYVCTPGRTRTLSKASVVLCANPLHYRGIWSRVPDSNRCSQFCRLMPKPLGQPDICFVKVSGLEPKLTEPKSVVLPLHHTSISGRGGKIRTLTAGFGDHHAAINTTPLYIFLMIWTHISFHPILEELYLWIKKILIPFIKVLPVSLVDIVSPFIPQILS